MHRRAAVFLNITALCLSAATPVAAQDATSRAARDSVSVAAPDTASVGAPDKAPRGAQFLIPLGSVLVPGLGQYLHGEPLTGAAYTGAALTGLLVAANVGASTANAVDFPRAGRDQLAAEAAHVYQTAGFLSAWDAFHRAIPALQREGKYEFLTTREDLGDLLTAPFETEFLGRWTTWVNLAFTAAMAGIVLAEHDPGVAYEPFRARDAAFVTSLSLNAGVGEEALFRGWLLPHFHQNLGERFWVANALQAGIFGLLHVDSAGEFAVVIGAAALYDGWVTRRNDWSIREAVFNHFWYDLAIGAATLLVDKRDFRVELTFPTIRF